MTTAPASTDDLLLHDAQALNAALGRLLRVYQFRDRDTICCYDISVTQCYALETVIEQGPLRSQALAAALMLDKSTTTRVVDALERKGYVVRRADPDDARALALSATEAGRALHARIDADLVAQQVELLRGLPADLRAGVAGLIDRLAGAAQRRFASGASVGGCAPVCAPAGACAQPD